MGRHSAPDDDGDVAVDVAEPAAPAADLASRHGRHSAPEDDGPYTDADTQHTQMIAVVDAELVEAVEAHDTQSTDELPVPPLEAPPVEGASVEAAVDAAAVDAAAVETAPVDAAPVEAPPGPSKAEVKAARAAEKQQRKEQRKTEQRESETKADLRLLRRRPIVRLQLVVVVLISFAVYWLVMALLGRTDVFVYWLWVPIVLSGVLIGLVLDLAHRRERRQTPPSDP